MKGYIERKGWDRGVVFSLCLYVWIFIINILLYDEKNLNKKWQKAGCDR